MPELLSVASDFFASRVTPIANRLDGDTSLLHEVIGEMGEAGLMSLRRPMEYGGPEMPEMDFRSFQEMVAQTSGALSFLQTQHQSAVSMISRSENARLKEKALPRAHKPEGWMAIWFSQLRRPGPPVLRAERVADGYVIDGHIPWITGHGFFPRCLIGAQLPNREAVFGLIPFSEQTHGESSIRCSEPMRLAAMTSAMTVTADLTKWYVPDDDVAFIQPEGWIHANDMVNVTLQSWFALGCAKAGLALVWRAYEKRSTPFLKESHDALMQEVATCRQQTMELERPIEERLQIRARAIDLASRCALAGVAASGGAANSLDHPAQRIYRESMVYCVSAQTTPILAATLSRLVRRGVD